MNQIATQQPKPQGALITTPGQLQQFIIDIITSPIHAKTFEGVIDRQAVVIAMMHIRQNWNYLSRCKPDSIFNALAQAGAYGWTCDPITGHAFVIPFGDQAVLVPGYRGLLDLVRRAGEAKVTAEIVYQGDTFASNGLWSYPSHIPSEDIDRRKKPLTHVYAVARFNDGSVRTWIMSRAELLDHRNNHCPSWGRNQKESSLWHERNPGFAAMCRKTVLIKAIKSGEVPISLVDNRGRQSLATISADDTSRPEGATNQALLPAPEPLTVESPAGYHETVHTEDQAPYSVGDDIASDAAKEIHDQTPAEPGEIPVGFEVLLGQTTSQASVQALLIDWQDKPECRGSLEQMTEAADRRIQQLKAKGGRPRQKELA